MEEKILKTIKDEIENSVREMGYELEKVVLFGSRARRDFNEESDWDILIIVKEDIPRDEKLKLFSKISQRLAQHSVFCDLLIRSREEVEKLKNYFHSVTKTALEEGISL